VTFALGQHAFTVEQDGDVDSPVEEDGCELRHGPFSSLGYACSFACAKEKVDSLPHGYVWVDGKRGGEPLYEKKSPGRLRGDAVRKTAMESDRLRHAAERLGVRFARCPVCSRDYVWDANETFSVMTNPPDGVSDYDDGNSDIVFCCSHLCASHKLATLPSDTGIIWRGGKCGGTSMPSLEEP